MSAGTNLFRAFVGLFVDDGAFALAIVAVVLLAFICASPIGMPLIAGAVLLVGCLSVLFGSVISTVGH